MRQPILGGIFLFKKNRNNYGGHLYYIIKNVYDNFFFNKKNSEKK